jgi:hypothetical protein
VRNPALSLVRVKSRNEIFRSNMKSCFVTLIIAAANAAAASIYTWQQDWPTIPAIYNLSSITAVAVANGSTGSAEIHVAQRGTGAPPVLVFERGGTFLRSWGTENVTSIHGIQAESGNPSTLWITDVGDATVKQFAIDGGLLRSIGTPGVPGTGTNPLQFSEPADVAFGPTGTMAISDGDSGINNRVSYISTSNLGVERVFGGLGSAPGQFSSPHSIAFDSVFDRFWVADRGNLRIQAFLASNGTWVGQFDSCFAPGIPWGVRIDNFRGRMIVADGANMALYILQIIYGDSPLDIGSCKMLQNITLPANSKPHELAFDDETGDVYLAGVGSDPIIRKYVLN